MANSLIGLKGQSLWVGDSLLEVILFDFTKLLKEELSKRELINDCNLKWFSEYHNDLIYYLKGFSTGGIDFELESILENENRLNVFKDLLRQVRQILIMKGNEISIKELNLIEDLKPIEKSYWQNPLETQLVIDVIDKIQSMLETT